MSPIAIDFLRRRRIEAANATRPPLSVIERDFQVSSTIVAIDESLDRKFIESKWPEHAARIQYWRLDDDKGSSLVTAFEEYEERVKSLIENTSDVDSKSDRHECLDAA